MRRALFPATLAIAIAVTLAPLWSTRHLPSVDAPQHLFLVHVLRALQDPASPYHATYEAGLRFTYVTFYGGTALLSSWFGEETALRIWLSLVIAAIPLAVLAMLRAFGRNPWLALLACPIVYTDGFYWGLFGFHSALAPALACTAWCARALQEPAEERRWCFLFGLAAVLVVLTHVAALPLPVLGTALLLYLTPTDARRRRNVLLASLPALALVALWLLLGVQQKRGIDLGKHWSGTGSLLDPSNYAFTSIVSRAEGLIGLLGNGFRSHADLWPVLVWLALVVSALFLAVRQGRAGPEPRERDLRPAGLLAIALACYFCLPTDVSGYMYMIHSRYAQLAALCAIPVITRLGGRAGATIAALAAALALGSGILLSILFHRFERETQPFEAVATHLPKGSRVMHLVVENESRVATHAVYLHYAALAALRCEGVPSFSLAQDPSYPVNYRPGGRPPAPWEWRPGRFSWDAQARHYDAYLVRGAAPAELFGEHAGEVQVVAQEGTWTLLQRRTP